MVSKQVLRATYLEKRLFLSDDEYDLRNKKIQRMFTEHIDLSGILHLHTFLPITEKREVNTWLFIHYLREAYPGITLYTSRSLRTGELEHYILEENTRLLVNKWGIPEPAEATPLIPERLDLILVPLIICDKQGHRIGYGKGYYDRFLDKFPGALKAGVSLSPLLDKINVMEERDIALDLCLTPFSVHRFA